MDTRETILTLSQILTKIFQFLIIVVPITIMSFIIYGRWRDTKSPNVIAVGGHHSNSYLTLIAVAVIYIIFRLFQIDIGEISGSRILIEFFLIGIIIVIALIGFFGRVYIFNDGIMRNYLERLYWHDIGAYYWDKHDQNLVHFSNKKGRTFKVKIPPEKRALVNQVFETHLKTV